MKVRCKELIPADQAERDLSVVVPSQPSLTEAVKTLQVLKPLISDARRHLEWCQHPSLRLPKSDASKLAKEVSPRKTYFVSLFVIHM